MNNNGLSAGERAMLRHEVHCDLVEERAARLSQQKAEALAREMVHDAREQEERNERNELLSLYSDMYKDRYWHRPGCTDLRTISLADLRRKVDDLAATPLPLDDEFV